MEPRLGCKLIGKAVGSCGRFDMVRHKRLRLSRNAGTLEGLKPHSPVFKGYAISRFDTGILRILGALTSEHQTGKVG